MLFYSLKWETSPGSEENNWRPLPNMCTLMFLTLEKWIRGHFLNNPTAEKIWQKKGPGNAD